MASSETAQPRPRAIAREIQNLYAEGQQPSFAEVDIRSWHRALDILLDQNDYAAARFGASLLLARHPDLKAMKMLCRMIDVAPRTTEGLDLARIRKKSVEVIRREGAGTVLFAFTGHLGSLGMPIGMAHRWLGRLDASIVYLHDFSNRSFFHGLRSIADSRAGTVAELRKIAGDLGARRIACYGNGLAGYAATLYAIDLGADAVVSMDGPTNLARAHGPLADMPDSDVPRTLDAALAGTTRPPQILVLSGDERARRSAQTDEVAHLPSVTLGLIERYGGPVAASELVCRGQFERVLEWLMTASPEAPRDVGTFKYYPWLESIA